MFGKKPPSDLEARIAKIEADAQKRIEELRRAVAIRNCEGRPPSNISGPPEESLRGCYTCVVKPWKCPVNQRIRGGGTERRG